MMFCLAAKGQYRVYFENSAGKEVGSMEVRSGELSLGTTDAAGSIEIADTALLEDAKYYRYDIEFFFKKEDPKPGKNILYRHVDPPMEHVLVTATRQGSRAIANTVVGRAQIAEQNTGRDLPMMLQLQPSVVVTSDAGNGVGYTGIRVRGSDASRTNITVNGVPINDAESQGTFWVNMPDLGSSVRSVQIQRGVGSSSNGPGAFGASVNIETFSGDKAYGLLSNSYGSFNTRKHTLAGGTGLIDKHWNMDFRISRIYSDGFVDRAFSDLNSWMFSAGYKNEKNSLKFLTFSGSERTYQAWYGVPTEKLDSNTDALRAHYNRNLGFIYFTSADSANLFGSGRSYNYYNYKNQVDNYAQSHYHLYFNHKFNNALNLNSTLFYTKGKGYFEEFKLGQDVRNYGFQPFVQGPDTFRYSDLVRRRWLDNDLIGVNISLQRQKLYDRAVLGANFSQYSGNHFGQVIWAQIIPKSSPEKRYYLADGDKSDMSVFMKVEHLVQGKMEYGADLQLRHVRHSGFGSDNDGRHISFDRKYTFFNPKAWFIYHSGVSEQLYINISRGSREPSRSDITDNGPGLEPKPEYMTDMEMGYKMNRQKIAFNVNAFYMNYQNQLVLTGQVNDVGSPLHINVDKSYRTGIELSAAAQARKNILITGNVTASSNRIRDLDIYYPNYDTVYIAPVHKENTAIGFSPALTAALQIKWSLPGDLNIQWVHKYVSRQYLDNSEQRSRSLNPYYFSEIWINKSWKFQGSIIQLQFQVLNVFDAHYASNGYTYGYYLSPTRLVQESSVYPQAGRNFMGAVVLKF